jgi:hypothetical protein
VNQPAPGGFIPPRPNLGPEPWPEDQPIAGLLLVAVAAACVLLGWFLWRRVRHRGVQAKPGGLAARGEPDNTPRGRLLALGHSIREALTVQFGAPWRAKTTEELAADAQLEQVLGCDGLQELIRFLDQVDRLKFAPERSNHRQEALEAELAAWHPRLLALKQRIETKPAGRGGTRNADPARPSSRNVLRA